MGDHAGSVLICKGKQQVHGEHFFNLIEEISYLLHLDINNQYGWGMSEPFPTGGFKWEKEVERFTPKKIASLVKNGRKGYLLEVDVEYPIELHDNA